MGREGSGVCLVGRRICSGGLGDHGVAPADLPELAAPHDGLDRRAEAALTANEPGHLVEQGVIGKLHAAPEGVAEQLAAELAGDGLAALRQQVRAKAVEAVETWCRPGASR